MGMCASLLAPWASNVRGDPAQEKRSEVSLASLGELVVSSEQGGFSLLEASAAAKEGKKKVFVHSLYK